MIKKIALVLFVVSLFLVVEPFLSKELSFAVTYFGQSKVNSASAVELKRSPEATHMIVGQPNEPIGRAPEPSTLILFLSGVGGIFIRFARKSFDKFKRASDFFLAILGLAIASPILVLAAILIKLSSPGPIVYRQERVGLNGKTFRIYKLRTMYSDAENTTGAVWAKKNDPRATSVGNVLRKTHLDEIPQLINVLKGEMSIVGPRPERPELVRDFKNLICDYEKRLQMKPGITGIAQVWHKYDETVEDVKKKIKYDLLYARKMCLAVDLKILANTLMVVLTGRGAR